MQAVEHLSYFDDWWVEQRDVRIVDDNLPVEKPTKVQHHEMEKKNGSEEEEKGLQQMHLAANVEREKKEVERNEIDLYKEMEEFGMYLNHEIEEDNTGGADKRTVRQNEVIMNKELGQHEKNLKCSGFDLYEEMEELGVYLDDDDELEQSESTKDKGIDSKIVGIFKGMNENATTVNNETQIHKVRENVSISNTVLPADSIACQQEIVRDDSMGVKSITKERRKNTAEHNDPMREQCGKIIEPVIGDVEKGVERITSVADATGESATAGQFDLVSVTGDKEIDSVLNAVQSGMKVVKLALQKDENKRRKMASDIPHEQEFRADENSKQGVTMAKEISPVDECTHMEMTTLLTGKDNKSKMVTTVTATELSMMKNIDDMEADSMPETDSNDVSSFANIEGKGNNVVSHARELAQNNAAEVMNDSDSGSEDKGENDPAGEWVDHSDSGGEENDPLGSVMGHSGFAAEDVSEASHAGEFVGRSASGGEENDPLGDVRDHTADSLAENMGQNHPSGELVDDDDPGGKKVDENGLVVTVMDLDDSAAEVMGDDYHAEESRSYIDYAGEELSSNDYKGKMLGSSDFARDKTGLNDPTGELMSYSHSEGKDIGHIEMEASKHNDHSKETHGANLLLNQDNLGEVVLSRKRYPVKMKARRGNCYTKRKRFNCKKCNVRFKSLVYLRKHMIYYHGEKPFHCWICLKPFYTRQALNRHKRVHSDDRPYECTVCEKKFKVVKSLKRHMVIHTGVKPYKCKVCGKGFGRKDHMHLHLEKCTTPGRKYIRRKKEAEETFKSSETVQDKSQSVEVFDFEEEESNGSNLTDYGTEMDPTEKEIILQETRPIYANGKLYQCYICERGYSSIHSLNRHVKSHNIDESIQPNIRQIMDIPELEKVKPEGDGKQKPFRCHLCQRRYAHRATLRRHLRSHRKGIIITQVIGNFKEDEEIQQDDTKKSGTEGAYSTNELSETLDLESYSMENALAHVKGKKDHACEVCGKRFGYRNNLIRHKILHCRGTVQGATKNSDSPQKVAQTANFCTSLPQQPSQKVGTSFERKSSARATACESWELDGFSPASVDNDIASDGQENIPMQIEGKGELVEDSIRNQNDGLLDTESVMYPCPKCSIKFKNLANLRRHMFIHSGLKPYKCFKCGRGFNRKENMRAHMGSCLKRRGEGHRYEKNLGLKSERSSQKKVKKSYICTICEKVFHKEILFKQHLVSHYGQGVLENFKEDSKPLENPDSVSGMIIEKGKKFFRCKECNFEFVTQADLNLHQLKHKIKNKENFMQNIYGNESGYSPNDMGTNSVQNVDGQEVSVPHHIVRKQYACTICPMKLKNRETLKQHMFIHTGLKPFKCPECKKSFNRRYNLKLHYQRCMRRKALVSLKPEKYLNVTAEPEKYLNVSAELPDKSNRIESNVKVESLNTQDVTSTSVVDEGMIEPNAESVNETTISSDTSFQSAEQEMRANILEGPPYKCSVCDREFKYEGRLHHHMVTHPEVKAEMEESGCSTVPLKVHVPLSCLKKLACPYCFKRFANIANLRRHVLLHTGQKPYKCLKCGKYFIRKYSYKIHMLSCHKKQGKAVEHSETFEERRIEGGTNVIGVEASVMEVKPSTTEVKAELEDVKPSSAEVKVDSVELKTTACPICSKPCVGSTQLRKHLIYHIEQKAIEELKPVEVLQDISTRVPVQKRPNFIRKSVKITPVGPYKVKRMRGDTANDGDRMPYECSLCGRQFKCRGHLNMHLRRHPAAKPGDQRSKKVRKIKSSIPRPYSCPECHNKFTTGANLKQHMMVHTGLKPFKCNNCGKDFRRKYRMKVHNMRCVKTTKKTVSESLPQKSDKDEEHGTDSEGESSSKQPNSSTQNNPNNDSIEKNPERSLTKASELGKETKKMMGESNYEFIEELDKAFKCTECGREFKCQGHLNLHMKKHPGVKSESLNSVVFRIDSTTDPVISDSVTSIESQAVKIHIPSYNLKKLSCPECSVRFANIGNLKRHMFTSHTGLRPYKCNNCGRDFNRKYSFKLHKIKCSGPEPETDTYTPTRPREYKCTICNESFQRRILFRQHMATHLDDKISDNVDVSDMTDKNTGLPSTEGVSSEAMELKDKAPANDDPVSESEDQKNMNLKVAVKRLALPDGGHHTFSVSKCGENCGQICSSEKHIILPNETKDLTYGEEDDVSSTAPKSQSVKEICNLSQTMNIPGKPENSSASENRSGSDCIREHSEDIDKEENPVTKDTGNSFREAATTSKMNEEDNIPQVTDICKETESICKGRSDVSKETENISKGCEFVPETNKCIPMEDENIPIETENILPKIKNSSEDTESDPADTENVKEMTENNPQMTEAILKEPGNISQIAKSISKEIKYTAQERKNDTQQKTETVPKETEHSSKALKDINKGTENISKGIDSIQSETENIAVETKNSPKETEDSSPDTDMENIPTVTEESHNDQIIPKEIKDDLKDDGKIPDKAKNISKDTMNIPTESESISNGNENLPKEMKDMMKDTKDNEEEPENIAKETEKMSEERENDFEENENISEETEDIPDESEDILEESENNPEEEKNDCNDPGSISGKSKVKKRRKIGPLDCTYCRRRFTMKSKLMEHMISHSTEKRHTCSICDKKFKFKGSLTKHVPKCIRKRKRLGFAYPEYKGQGVPEVKEKHRFAYSEYTGDGDLESSKSDAYMFAYSEFKGDSDDGDSYIAPGMDSMHPSLLDADLIPPDIAMPGDDGPGSSKEYECEICQRKCYHKSKYDQHMISHSQERIHECPHCKKKFKFKGSLMKHQPKCLKQSKGPIPLEESYNIKEGWHSMSAEKPNDSVPLYVEEKIFKCAICGHVSHTKLDLETHMSTHSKEEIEALLSATATRKDENTEETPMRSSPNIPYTDVDHQASKLEDDSDFMKNEEGYICHECGRTFVRLCDVRQHMQTHAKTNDYVCNVCGKDFKYRGNMLRHMKCHIPEYLAEYSNRGQDVQPSASISQETQPTAGPSPLSSSSSGIIKQDFVPSPIQQSQNRYAQRDVDDNAFIRTAEGFTCHKCGKVFKRRWNVKQHMASHVLTRDFICSVCGKDFKYKGDMTRHSKIVHGIFFNSLSYDNWQQLPQSGKETDQQSSDSCALEQTSEDADMGRDSLDHPELSNPSSSCQDSESIGILTDDSEVNVRLMESTRDTPELISIIPGSDALSGNEHKQSETVHAHKAPVKKEVETDIVIKEETEWW